MGEAKKKRKGGSKKGSPFERQVCKQLSLWWTQGERDDIFWRTSASGARATNRKKKGQSTRNSEGDVMALDPSGAPLLQFMALEIKRGYSTLSVQDFLDIKPDKRKRQLEGFLFDAASHKLESGARYGALIWRRDSREELIILPAAAVNDLDRDGDPVGFPCLLFAPLGTKLILAGDSLVVCRLGDFLARFTPQDVLKALERAS